MSGLSISFTFRADCTDNNPFSFFSNSQSSWDQTAREWPYTLRVHLKGLRPLLKPTENDWSKKIK